MAEGGSIVGDVLVKLRKRREVAERRFLEKVIGHLESIGLMG
jgi:hypothetical protein